jgi:hypothetical protein
MINKKYKASEIYYNIIFRISMFSLLTSFRYKLVIKYHKRPNDVNDTRLYSIPYAC